MKKAKRTLENLVLCRRATPLPGHPPSGSGRRGRGLGFLPTALLILLSAIGVRADPQTVGYETLGLGDHSGCTHPAKMLITSESEWRRVWRVHSGTDKAPPRVDWTHQSVIALLSGTAGQGGSIQLMRVVREDDKLTLYVWRDAGAGHFGTQPYHFATIPVVPDDRLRVRFADASEMSCPTCLGEPAASSAPGDLH